MTIVPYNAGILYGVARIHITGCSTGSSWAPGVSIHEVSLSSNGLTTCFLHLPHVHIPSASSSLKQYSSSYHHLHLFRTAIAYAAHHTCTIDSIVWTFAFSGMVFIHIANYLRTLRHFTYTVYKSSLLDLHLTS